MLDLKEQNVLIGLTDPSILEQLVTKEIAESSLYKTIDGYNIYRSVNFGIPTKYGWPILVTSLAPVMDRLSTVKTYSLIPRLLKSS